MKNRLFYKTLIILFFCNLLFLNAKSIEVFNFDVSGLEISENGNRIKGVNRGTITANNNIVINANKFDYNKLSNVLKATGNVSIIDLENNYKIFAEDVTYFKKQELIVTKNNSKAIDEKGREITAEKLKYQKIKNILSASGNVKIKDNLQDYKIFADDIAYYKNERTIITEGKTNAIIQSKYEIKSEDITFFLDENRLSSKKKTRIKDSNSAVYHLDKFNYLIDKEILKGEKILIITNFNKPKSDKFYFSNAMIDLKNQKFKAKDTMVKIHKDIFDNSNNDPRLKGVSSTGDKDFTVINKGIFTSCKIKEGDDCPPWSIEAKEIKHDKKNKQLVYDNALLKVYNVPILYFPKFFHPDPTVTRQSGFLKPQINNSNVLGNSFSIPYFHVISQNKDFTSTPTFFEDRLHIIQNEYRQVNKNFKFTTNFGFANGYRSSLENKRNSIFNIFSKFDWNLDFDNFTSSDLFVSIEKVNNDTFLKIFDSHLQNTDLKPKNFDILSSEAKLTLEHENYIFDAGVQVYEDLQKISSDRYQYVLPYYNFSKTLSQNFIGGTIDLSSSGSNDLRNTNDLKSKINNDIVFNSPDYLSNLGFKNNFNINIKNLNSVGKNNIEYKSSPQIELMSLINFNASLPLLKKQTKYNNFLTPKLSFKFNPHDMKNYSNSDRKINTDNIFDSNRLGLSDSLESGKSLTLGVDYKKENIEDINKFFELKLATVFRDEEDNFIPNNSTINKKNSNLFGSISNNFSKYLSLDYNFAIDNNYNEFEYNDFKTTISINNFQTAFNFIEENGDMGDSNVLENKTSFNLDNKNFISFKTRRNRKLNLTEYYDLIYEYKNDCLTAGIKYKKSYYEDRDLKPAENLFFTITLFPLTTYEQKIDQ